MAEDQRAIDELQRLMEKQGWTIEDVVRVLEAKNEAGISTDELVAVLESLAPTRETSADRSRQTD